jgi:hypothetical protein
VEQSAAPNTTTSARPLIAFAVAMALIVPVGRAFVEGRRDLADGDRAAEAGDAASATLLYRHSAQWYVPGPGSDDIALTRLVELGDQLSAAGDRDAALFAWRSARDAIMATRHLFVPHAGLLPELHTRIADAMGAQAAERGGDASTHAAEFRAELEAWPERRRNPLLVLGASLGFYAWIATLALAAWRGFGADGTFNKRVFFRFFGASFALFAFWLACVRFA